MQRSFRELEREGLGKGKYASDHICHNESLNDEKHSYVQSIKKTAHTNSYRNVMIENNSQNVV